MKKEIVRRRRDYVKEHIMREEIQEIAEYWGVHQSTIEKDLIFLRRNEGLKKKSEMRDQRIKELLGKGEKPEKIADDINVTSRDVYYRIQKRKMGM